jgi:hypothetical protein
MRPRGVQTVFSLGTPHNFLSKWPRAQRRVLQDLWFCKTRRCAFWRALPALMLVCLSGCARSTVSQSTAGQKTGSAPVAAKTARNAASPQSWEKVLDTWWHAWQSSSRKSAAAGKNVTPKPATASNLPLVTIDVGALAARHPAWKLARALEENHENHNDVNRSAAYNFSSARALENSQFALAAPSFDVRFDEAGSASGGPAASTLPPAATVFSPYERAEESVEAPGLEALENQARDRQSEAIEVFLQDLTQRQASSREQYAAILRGALDEEVENTQRAIVDEPPIPQMAPDQQLLLTNLRLQLLRNVFTTDEQKQKARAQLDAILADWQKQLRAQAAARAAALQEARVEAPRHAREAGVARVRAELEAVRRAQQNARETVLRQQVARLHEDFGDQNARLGVVLPAASWPPRDFQIPDAPFFNPLLRALSNQKIVSLETIFPETNSGLSSSQTPFFGKDTARLRSVSTAGADSGMTAGNRPALIRALKAQAWRDARKQAQMAARRFGWRWQAPTASNASVPNRTRETLQWLFG